MAQLKSAEVGRFVLAWVALSLLCAALLVTFPHITWVRGTAGSTGFIAACLGIGLGLWCSLRFRGHRCYLAFVLSVPNFALWAYFLHLAIHDRLR